MRRLVGFLLCCMTLEGCTSIHHIGSIGELKVYSVKDTDFFSANRMLLVVDGQGRAVAGTGGTVAGPGPIAAGLAGSAILGAGVAYGGAALGKGLEHINIGGSLKVPIVAPTHIPPSLKHDIDTLK